MAKESGAHRLRMMTNPARVIKEEALLRYCNSRIDSHIGDTSCCITSQKHSATCPIYQTILSCSRYVDWDEEQTDAIGDCKFDDGKYPDSWIDEAYKLLPKEGRKKSDRQLKYYHLK